MSFDLEKWRENWAFQKEKPWLNRRFKCKIGLHAWDIVANDGPFAVIQCVHCNCRTSRFRGL